MAANVIDSLVISLGVDPQGVDKGMNQAESRLKSGVGNIVRNVLAPLAGAFAFGSLVSKYLSAADRLGELSQSLDIGVQELDAWSTAAAMSGGSAEAFQSTLSALNTKILDATVFGKKMAQTVFNELGIKLTGANGKAKTTIDIFRELAAMADTMDKTKFAGIARKLGLDQGTIMMLQAGSKEVDKLVGEMKDLAFTQRDAEVAGEFNDAIDLLGKTLLSASAIFMRVFVPVLSFVTQKFQVAINFLRKHEPFVMGFFTTLAVILGAKLLPILKTLIATAYRIALPFLPLLAIVTAVALAIDSLWAYINGGETALAEFWAIFGTGEEISQALAEAWEDLKVIGVALWTELKNSAAFFFSYFKSALGPLVESVKNALKLIKAIFTGNWAEAGKYLFDLLDSLGRYIIEVFTGAFRLVLDLVLDIFGKVGRIISDAIDAVKNFLGISSSAENIGEGSGQRYAAASIRKFSTSEAVRPALTGGTVDNSTRTDIKQDNKFYITSSDPRGASREVGAEMRSLTNTADSGGGH